MLLGVARAVAKNGRRVERQWWLDEENVAKRAFAAFDHLKDQQSGHRNMVRDLWNHYLEDRVLVPSRADDGLGRNREWLQITFNVLRNCVDGAMAKITKDIPRPMFLTDNADWTTQRQFERLTEYTYATFESGGWMDAAPLAYRDCLVGDNGYVRIVEDTDGEAPRVRYERALPDEIYVDERDARYGEPRSLFQVRTMPRDRMFALYGDDPEAWDAIDSAVAAKVDEDTVGDTDDDLVEVIEAWHLGSNERDPGRHIITLRTHCLVFEDYERDWFPFVVFRWRPPRKGWLGWSLARDLAGIQIEINRILADVSLGLARVARPRVFVPKGTADKRQFTSGIGGMVEFDPTRGRPEIITATAFNPETYNHLENLVRKAYELSGISQLSATGAKPAGLNAGVALREYQDIDTERFAPQAKRWENAHIDAARMTVAVSSEMFTAAKPRKQITRRSRFLGSIDWKDVDPGKNEFVVDVFPTSALPRTPSARMQQVSEMEGKGWLSPEQAMGLIDFPDVKKFTSLATAALDLATENVERILDGREDFLVPDESWNLPLAQQVAQQYLQRARLDGAPDDRLTLLSNYLDRIVSLQAPPQAAPAMVGATPDPAATAGLPSAGLAPPAPGVPPVAAE